MNTKFLSKLYFVTAAFLFAMLLLVATIVFDLVDQTHILQSQLEIKPEIEVLTVYVEPTPMPTINPEDVKKPWTETDVLYAAKTIKGEAGDCSVLQQSGVMWNILNRVDSPDFPNSIPEVVTAPGQYHGYSWSNEVDEEIVALVEDVLARWYLEKEFGNLYGRTLPKEYLFFVGDHKKTNYFSTTFRGTDYWDWSLPNPYEEVK